MEENFLRSHCPDNSRKKSTFWHRKNGRKYLIQVAYDEQLKKQNSFAENKTFYRRRSGLSPVNFYDASYFLERLNCKRIGISVFIVTIHFISIFTLSPYLYLLARYFKIYTQLRCLRLAPPQIEELALRQHFLLQFRQKPLILEPRYQTDLLQF